MKQQPLTSQKGEITFRRKLVEQQISDDATLHNEFDKGEIERLLRERMKQTAVDMTRLRDQGVALDPYLEIGAERGQRTLVLENDFGVRGAAIDISYDALRSCDYYAGRFDKPALPLRVCCDANLLPFMRGSLALVFCYSVLHHFPDPTPLVDQAHRVLAPGGHLWFDEEPYRKMLHLPLYRRNIHRYEGGSRIRRILDFFLSEKHGNEEVFDIISNQKISLGMWRAAFEDFEDCKVTIRSWLRGVETTLYRPVSWHKYLWSYLTGGVISGVVKKPGELPANLRAIEDVVICPDCLQDGCEVKMDRQDDGFVCVDCGAKCPVVEGVALLFTAAKLAELYPEYSP